MLKKPTASNTASRAVLLEQFDQRRTFEQALAHVQSELGPAAMTKRSGKHWWKEFSEGRRSLGANITTRDFQLAANSNLLKNKRALQCTLPVDFFSSQVYASNGRFFLLRHADQPCLFDSFHKQRRILRYDASEAVAKDPDFPAGSFTAHSLSAFVFVNEAAVLCKMDVRTEENIVVHFVVLARVDFKRGALCALSCVEAPTSVHAIQKVGEPATFFCHTTGRDVRKVAFLLTIDEEDEMSVGDLIILPTQLYARSCTYKDGVVYSFDATPYSCNASALHAYSVEDKQMDILDIKCSIEQGQWGSPMFWSNGVCLLYEQKKDSKINHLHEFRLETMEWRDLGLRVPDHVQFLAALPREPLVVVAERRHGECTQFFYRFAHGHAKKLVDLAWSAVLRRDEMEPGFAAKELEKLPPVMALRCPWVPVHKAAEKRPAMLELGGGHAAGPSGLQPKHHKADANVDARSPIHLL